MWENKAAEIVRTIYADITNIRNQAPLVHNITNFVVIKFGY